MTIAPCSRAVYHARMIELADKAFAEHRLSGVADPGALMMRRPGTAFYWTQVVLLANARVLVHGDIRGHLFEVAHESMDWQGDAAEHKYEYGQILGAAEWLSNPTETEYVTSKARLGAKMDTNPEVAAFELRQRLAAESRPHERIAYHGALDLLRDGRTVEEARRHVFDRLGDPEECRFGEVVAADVYYSMAACRRLAKLLRDALSVRGNPPPNTPAPENGDLT